MNDTSHYAECLTLVQKYKNSHLKRLVILAILLALNFYVHALTFGVKYAGESFQSSMVRNAENDLPVKSIDLNTGIGALLFVAAIMGIGLILFKKVQSVKIKIGYIIGAVAFLGIAALIQSGQITNAAAEGRIGVSHLAFGMGMLTLIFSLASLILALFGDHHHPKLYYVLIALLVIGGVTDCYHWLLASLMVLMYLIAIPEYRKMNWIIRQPGYPYFNERFDEQCRNSEYQPLHKLDNKSHGIMASLENDEEPVTYTAAVLQKPDVPMAAYTLDQNGAPDEMPGISDIFEQPVSLPEPELPDVDDIPAPVWNVPDNSTKSEILTDTSSILSDFPEIAGDIPDLPDIPDIPQL